MAIDHDIDSDSAHDGPTSFDSSGLRTIAEARERSVGQQVLRITGLDEALPFRDPS
jgi:hypothetical protein